MSTEQSRGSLKSKNILYGLTTGIITAYYVHWQLKKIIYQETTRKLSSHNLPKPSIATIFNKLHR